MIEAQITEEITKLSDCWYKLISKEHHKDRDCHWFIETKWSYGYKPIYTVQHHGYILHNFNEIECSSYTDALFALKDILKHEVEQMQLENNDVEK